MWGGGGGRVRGGVTGVDGMGCPALLPRPNPRRRRALRLSSAVPPPPPLPFSTNDNTSGRLQRGPLPLSYLLLQGTPLQTRALKPSLKRCS